MELSDFSRILTHLRKEKGVSQREAAEAMGVSQSLLSHYERGIRECGLLFLVRASDYYGVTTDYLLGRSYDKHGTTISVDELADEDATGRGNLGMKSMLPTLNKKLICNSVSVLMDLVGSTGDKTLINEISSYLGVSVYTVYRLVYNSNPENPQTLFGSDEEVFSFACDAAMSRSKAAIVKRLRTLSEPELFAMDQEHIKTKYPVLSTSLFNLLQNAETKIGARKK